VVQGDLDLHGLTRAEARLAVAEFLRESLRHARRCVRIVHGKGLGSKNREPVLKTKVRVWLAQREEVLAFCQAPVAHGGSGAVLVLLRA
jgi:DNA-nicking Smr family endonuclease